MEDLAQGQLTARRAISRVALIAAVAAAACDRARPPEPAPEVQPIARLTLDSNRTVELIGLRRWTADMVRDSLAKYSPDEGLDADAAAANLRNLLGFADAATSIHTVIFDENESATITLAVREPGDSARVHYAEQALDTVPRRAEWRDLARLFALDSTRRLAAVVANAHLDGPSRLVVDSTARGRRFTHREGYDYESPADSEAARPALAALAARTSDADFAAALATIDSSRSAPDRAVAALLLANFPERDAAWRALLAAAVGREQGRDAFIAQHALIALANRAPRLVDWSPSTATIHDVLDGTALVATGAAPDQAAAYLAGGGEMLTAYVESDNPDVRDSAHALLVALRGDDLGFEPGPWRDWIRSLR